MKDVENKREKVNKTLLTLSSSKKGETSDFQLIGLINEWWIFWSLNNESNWSIKDKFHWSINNVYYLSMHTEHNWSMNSE